MFLNASLRSGEEGTSPRNENISEEFNIDVMSWENKLQVQMVKVLGYKKFFKKNYREQKTKPKKTLKCCTQATSSNKVDFR